MPVLGAKKIIGATGPRKKLIILSHVDTIRERDGHRAQDCAYAYLRGKKKQGYTDHDVKLRVKFNS